MPYTQKFFGPSRDRDWSLVIGLKEGYTDGPVHSRSEVADAHKAWSALQPTGCFIPTGTMTESLLVYAWPQGGYFSGYAQEPVIIFEGRIHPQFHESTKGEDVWSQLQSFAEYVGERLNQRRMYIRYAGQELILEQQGG